MLPSPNAVRAQFATPPITVMVLSLPNTFGPSSHSRPLSECVAAAQNISRGVHQAALRRDYVAAAADVCGKVRYGAFCRDVIASPKMLVAKLKIDPEPVLAVELPTTKAAPNNPSAWASAPSPIARAPLNNVLVHSAVADTGD